jgi:hypothetical protein
MTKIHYIYAGQYHNESPLYNKDTQIKKETEKREV